MHIIGTGGDCDKLESPGAALLLLAVIRQEGEPAVTSSRRSKEGGSMECYPHGKFPDVDISQILPVGN